MGFPIAFSSSSDIPSGTASFALSEAGSFFSGGG
jgi:hypothetical protein